MKKDKNFDSRPYEEQKYQNVEVSGASIRALVNVLFLREVFYP
jgi:hypothetical protein